MSVNRKPVLVVDDDVMFCKVVKTALQAGGYQVLEANDGVEALSVAHKVKHSIIILDLFMPKMDGYTCCMKIKGDKSLKEIPLIILSGADHKLNEELSKQLGADAFFAKPVAMADLVNSVGNLLSHEH